MGVTIRRAAEQTVAKISHRSATEKLRWFFMCRKRLFYKAVSLVSVQSIIGATDSFRDINLFSLSLIFIQNPLDGRGWRSAA